MTLGAAFMAFLQATNAAPMLKEMQYQKLFSDFVAKYDKQYETKDVFAKYATFKKNHFAIQQHNEGDHSYSLGLNEFADLTTEEFASLMTGTYVPKNSFIRAQNAMEKDPNFVSTDDYDWVAAGAVTPVKNQGQCGSCWAFSTTGSTEGANQIANGKLVSLSEQQLVDCAGSSGNQGCNGGLMDNAFEYIIGAGGLCTEDDYSYTGRDGTCQKSCTPAVQVKGYKDVTQGSEDDLMEALSKGPVSIAIEADQFGFQFYSGGVFSGTCGKQLDHGVLLVGAGTDNGKDYWTVKNSWGGSWGEQGYIRMIRGQDQCGLSQAASYPTM